MSEINERLVIASLFSPERIVHLGKRNIRASEFVHHRDKLEFIFTYYQQYRQVPTPGVLTQKFPSYEPVKPDVEALDFYIDELKRERLEHRLKETVERELPKFSSDPGGAIRALQLELSKLEISDESDVSHTDRDALKRLAWYEEKQVHRRNGKITGVPTGLDYFQSKGEGFDFGSLLTIAGHTWVGKSWMLMYFALRAYLAGHRVLMVSCEMTTREEELRFDALLSGIKKKSLPFSMLRAGSGDLTTPYEDFLTGLSTNDNWMTLDASALPNFEMADIMVRVDQLKPDVVAIDGMEFLQDSKISKNRAGWEEVKAIIRQAKLLATSRNVVVMATAQANFKNSGDDRMPRMKDVAYSQDIVRASDYLITLAKSEEDGEESSKMRAYSIQKERNGPGSARRLKLRFDPWEGEIGEIRDENNPYFETA